MHDKNKQREELALELGQIKKEFISRKFRKLCLFFFIVGIVALIYFSISNTWLEMETFLFGPFKGEVLLYVIIGVTVIWPVLYVVSWRLARREKEKNSEPAGV